MRIILPLLSILAVVAVVFSFGITDGHISMDDWGYIYGCPFVRGGLTLDNLVRAYTEIGYDAFWMPLTYVTYMCDISLFGGGWQVHHAVNVLIHLANVLLVVFLLRMIIAASCEASGRRAWMLATIAALVWAIHPMRAEAVTYIASRKELLWSFFTLAGLLLWLRYLSCGRRSCYVMTALCCLAACQSKPTAVCFPALAYLLEWLQERRCITNKLRRYIPFLLISFAVGCIVLYAQANPIDHERLDVFGETFSWRLLNACVGFGMYLWHTIVPSQVYFDYRAVFGGRPLDLGLGLSVLGVASITLIAIVFAFRRDKGTCVALVTMTLWFFVALAPVSGIMGTVNGDHAYADRYTYVPFVGVTAIGAVLTAHCKRCVLRCLAAVSVVVIVFESWYAIEVVRSFENDYKAFSRTLERDADHWRALRVVGNEYCARIGRIDDGVQMLERSLLLRPSQHTAESLAYVLSIRGADGDFERVRVLCAGVAKSPAKDHHGMMLDALGNVCFREGKDADAVGFYNSSLKADRRNYSSWHTEFNLALVLANCGRIRESMLLLSRLKASGGVGVRASCARVILQLKSGLGTRFVWNADPFALPAMH